MLGGVSLSLGPGERLGVLGRNGAGKSTLMRLIAGELAPQAGERTPAPELATGFFAQLELEQLDGAASALAELGRRGGTAVSAWTPQQQRDHLGRFGFRGERVFEPTANFSGGERSRLALAILVARRPNLLLLDEPTNHLDLSMRHTLLMALQEFAGAVVVVSHDRALLRGVCDRFVLVAGGQRHGLRRRPRGLRRLAGSSAQRRAAGVPRRGAALAARAAPAGGRGAQPPEPAARRAAAPRDAAGATGRRARGAGSTARRPGHLQRRAARRAGAPGAPAHGELAAETARVEERWLEVMTALEQAS